MDKASVVAIREALKYNEENRAFRVAFDNGIIISTASDQIFWNDDTEIVVAITADNDGGSFIAGLPIRVICSTYENIQFIMGNTNPEKLEDVIDGLTEIVSISDEDKSMITDWYEKLYSPNYRLAHKNYEPIDIIRD